MKIWKTRLWKPLLANALALLHAGAMAAPTVTVTALNSGQASESGPTPGFFEFTRTGDLSTALAVNFVLGGTATRGEDYLVWETNALFSAGASRTHVTILPCNDARAEGVETVVLTVDDGPDDVAGGAQVATVAISDRFVAGRPGVWDGVATGADGLPSIAADITYLDAWITNGQLNIAVGLADAGNPLNQLEIFLDTDQRRETGDWRPGHVAGLEFRVHGAAGFLAGYELYRLPTNAPAEPWRIEDDLFVAAGAGTVVDDGVTYSIPLTRLGSPVAVDVFVASHVGAGVTAFRGVGDRVPRFGALDTACRQIVVRRPARTRRASVTDPSGDVNGVGFDLRGAEIEVVADQFMMALRFGAFFDPANTLLFPGPMGEVLIDGDRSVLTGAFPMGVSIPTWGADAVLEYDLSTPVPVFLLVPFSSGHSVDFGQGRNDGRWVSPGGRELIFSGSISLLDPLLVGLGRATPERVACDGRVVLQTATFNQLGGLSEDGFADRVPGGARVLDSETSRVLEPLAWEPARTISVIDPLDYPPPPLSGQDLVQVDVEIVRNLLVIKGTLSAWGVTDAGNVFEVALDADSNASTAPLGALRNGAAGPVIGVDYRLQMHSVDTGGAKPIYIGLLLLPDGTTLRVDAAVFAQPNLNIAQPGGFTVTLPLDALSPSGPQIRFLVTAARPDFGLHLLDIAPSSPMVLNTTAAVAPFLSFPPRSQEVTAGEPVQFIATAGGSAPLAWQWHRNGIALPGQTNITLAFNGAGASDAGDYTVTVSNDAGSITSPVAVLTVHPAPRFTGLVRRPGRGVEITLTGQPGRVLEVQVSTNLVHWLPLIILTNVAGTSTCLDPAEDPSPARFHRAHLLAR